MYLLVTQMECATPLSAMTNERTNRLKLYHFDLGDTTSSSIGFCARIKAHTPERALDRLRDLLPDQIRVLDDGEEYITVYTNSERVDLFDISDLTEIAGISPHA